MPECEYCGKGVLKVYACTNCGIRFCEDCGSPTDKRCMDCQPSGWEY